MKNLNHEFLRYLTCDLEMDPVEIAASSANELLDTVLTYEGYGMDEQLSEKITGLVNAMGVYDGMGGVTQICCSSSGSDTGSCVTKGPRRA